MASVRGKVADIDGGPIWRASVRLIHPDGTGEPLDTQTDRAGAFEFRDVAPGWYILSSFGRGFGDAVKAAHIEDASIDTGVLTPLVGRVTEGNFFGPEPPPPPIRVLTVCEALENRDTLRYQEVVIVGIFKSGMDETLRLDCPTQLVTGEVGWPSSIGLTGPSMPPDKLRGAVEKKRQEVLKSGPPGAQPRPERVVGLYGTFADASGFTSAPCCMAALETVLPPARLFGVAEKDLRVIR
jgi:hypothetical protein